MPNQLRVTKRDRVGSELGTYVTKLEEAEFAEVRDGAVSGFDGNDELHKGHLLGAHQIHVRQLVYELLHFSRQRNRKKKKKLFFFTLFSFSSVGFRICTKKTRRIFPSDLKLSPRVCLVVRVLFGQTSCCVSVSLLSCFFFFFF